MASRSLRTGAPPAPPMSIRRILSAAMLLLSCAKRGRLVFQEKDPLPLKAAPASTVRGTADSPRRRVLDVSRETSGTCRLGVAYVGLRAEAMAVLITQAVRRHQPRAIPTEPRLASARRHRAS